MTLSQHYRFLSHISPPDANGCTIWKGKLTKDRCGAFTLSNKELRAHRVAFTISKGEIPPGHQVLHTCSNRLCMTPSHLYSAPPPTKKEKPPKPPRTSHWASKLTPDDIIAIRAAREDGEPLTKIAKDFDTTISTIWNIVHRITWKHIPQPTTLPQ